MNFITMTLFRETINITPPYYSLYLLFNWFIYDMDGHSLIDSA